MSELSSPVCCGQPTTPEGEIFVCYSCDEFYTALDYAFDLRIRTIGARIRQVLDSMKGGE